MPEMLLNESNAVKSLSRQGFVSIRVNKQEYFGMPARVILMADVTKKVRSRLNSKLAKEKEQQVQHAENFKSTVNHEMCTPLESILFFVRQIQIFFT